MAYEIGVAPIDVATALEIAGYNLFSPLFGYDRIYAEDAHYYGQFAQWTNERIIQGRNRLLNIPVGVGKVGWDFLASFGGRMAWEMSETYNALAYGDITVEEAKARLYRASGNQNAFTGTVLLLNGANNRLPRPWGRGPGRTALYRAVGPEELADLRSLGRFRNPSGIEHKYFSTTEAGARTYARMAEARFGDPPYAFVRTSIPSQSIGFGMRVTVDAGISTVTVPTAQLPTLSKPVFLP